MKARLVVYDSMHVLAHTDCHRHLLIPAVSPTVGLKPTTSSYFYIRSLALYPIAHVGRVE